MSRTPFDLKIYLITDTPQCGSLGVVETVRQSVAAGATMVQLRDPDATPRELEALGAELVSVLAPTGVPLIVNDHAWLVPRIGAAGLHIGQSDLDPREARAQIGPDAILGYSVQTVEQVVAARSLGNTIDYLGVGPVWPTGSKDDAAPAGGTALLTKIVLRSPWRCVAIGGITAARVPEVKHAAAAGVSVISAICGQPDVGAATRELVRQWRES